MVNNRGWAFAYGFDNSGSMVIYDVDNYRNLNIPNENVKDLNQYMQLTSIRAKNNEGYSPIGYGWWAIRHEDGYVYIHHRNGNVILGMASLAV